MTSFSARTDRHLVRTAGHSRRHVLLALTAPRARRKKAVRPPVNVAFVLDRSGSMGGDKIALARYAVERALKGLGPKDRFSVVAYDDHIETVVASRTATPSAKQEALLRLQTIDARGSTDLHGGWAAGAAQVQAHLGSGGVNRCLLLTDGLANVGLVEDGALASFARDLRASGVPTSTFGLGEGFNEVLLSAIADAGGGHFYFIGRAEHIVDAMTSELGELLETVAREVVVDVKHHPALELQPLTPVVDTAAIPGELKLLIGDLVAGQNIELVLEVRFPEAPVGIATTAFFTVGDRDGVLKADGCTLAWQHAEATDVEAEPRDRDVDRVVARTYASRARQEAVHLNRIGEYTDARRALRGVARRIRHYAGSDAELNELAGQLVAEEAAFSAPMPELDRKGAHFRSFNEQRSRDSGGRARR